jgi:uncharacterized protein with ParB-like and HNH nuclease domain
MKADSLKISKVFSSGGDVHYLLPYFQREYAWDKENWQTLINDVIGLYEAYSDDKEPEHFMGALVVINDGTRNGVIPAFKLVDGQQRLVTISLMFCALGQLIQESHQALYKRIRRLLINDQESGVLYFKIVPTKKYGDQQAYFAILDQKPIPENIDSKIPECYQFFLREIGTRINNGLIEPERFFLVLANSLQVVFIDLDKGERPYEIFESLNAKNKPLTQADLVRNYIAMKLPETRQEEIFENYWAHIENLLQDKRLVGGSRLGELTAFLRHYLTMRSGVLVNERHVYERFRDRMEKEAHNTDEFIKEIIILKKFANYYDRLLRPEHETNETISIKLRRLNILEISTAYPFLMMVYEYYEDGKIDLQEFSETLKILENYMVRRYLVGEPTNYLNKVFTTLWREINPTQFVETLRSTIITKNYPSDSVIKRELPHMRLYGKGGQAREKLVLVLETINRFLDISAGGYTVLNGKPTIEHIMPQTLSPNWEEHLGANWEQIYKDYLDTIGNLTLVTQEWNTELSNAPFEEKRHRFSNHALKLNSLYFSQEGLVRWNDEAILKRAEFLTEKILIAWPELGTPTMIQVNRGLRPVSLTILGETFPVNTWRDVAYQTALVISQLTENFETQIASQMPAYFDKHPFRNACKQLPNGWYLYLNLSAASIKNFCQNLISLAGLSVEDWQVEEK